MRKHFSTISLPDFLNSDEFRSILSDYFDCLKLEDEPEKGERRVSDDFIFVLEEMFRESTTINNLTVPDALKLFRIGLLEFCLSQSIYNFDIALQLTKLYQELNLNSLFFDKLKYFEFKGIQLESLGYIAIRQLILNNDASALNFWYTKYYTFLKRNSKDVQNLKAKAMQSQNYDKVDEFYQYQDYLEKSYFNQLVKYFKNTSQVREKLTNDTWINDFCAGLAAKGYQFTDDKYSSLNDEILAKSFTRTQDLGVWTCKYSTVPKYSEVTSKWRVSNHYTTAPNDPIFGYLKFSAKCNYKPGLANSLGFFEHPLMFQIYNGLNVLTALLHQKSTDSDSLNKILTSLNQKIETFEKVLEEDKDRDDFVSEYRLTKYLLQFFKAWFALNALSVQFIPLKEIKSEQDKLNEALEATKETVNDHFASISTALKDNGFWKSETGSAEEVKLDHSNLSDVHEYFSARFTHTQEGIKVVNFLNNYVLPMFSVAFSAFNQTVVSLSPKKKKKTAGESVLSTLVIQPSKDVLKAYKEWVNSKVDLYTNKATLTEFHSFVEQIQDQSAR